MTYSPMPVNTRIYKNTHFATLKNSFRANGFFLRISIIVDIVSTAAMQTHKTDPQIGACSGICAIIMPAARMQEMTVQDTLIEHKLYIDRHGQDMPEILNWKWNN